MSTPNPLRIIRRARGELARVIEEFSPALPVEAQDGYRRVLEDLDAAELASEEGDEPRTHEAVDDARATLKFLELRGIFQPVELNYARMDALRLLDGLA